MKNPSEPQTTTITIKSTSACCKGKIIEVKIDEKHKQEFNEVIKNFIEKIEQDKDKNINIV